eukprot:3495059-Ditylum_brightwellii.AAC.1
MAASNKGKNKISMHWQNKWSLLITHPKDLENKINDSEFAKGTDMEETENIIKELTNTSKEIDKAIHHCHAVYDLYHKNGHYKDKELAALDKKRSIKATLCYIEHICGGDWQESQKLKLVYTT